ncbi:MAG TPA: DUF2804 domain-containing protein, partial [Eubacteriaceae bacterium]|nr:DUF2804 domain-containing protein [Eubacteriaceae bacterium]
MSQTRLTPGPLLDEQGHLSQAGYATNLVKTYDRKKIKAAKLRIKEWDYYLIHNQEFALAMTVADNAYMGLISASFLNFTTGEQHTVSPMLILPMGKLNMPADSEAGDIHVKNKRAQVHFTHQSDGRRLQFEMADFQDGFPLVADLHLSPTMKESMVIATPFPNKPKAFYYNQKIVGMRASGSVHYKNKEYRFDPTDSLGLLD